MAAREPIVGSAGSSDIVATSRPLSPDENTITEADFHQILALLDLYTERIRTTVNMVYTIMYRMILIVVGAVTLLPLWVFSAHASTVANEVYSLAAIFVLPFLFKLALEARAARNEAQMTASRLEKVVAVASSIDAYALHGLVNRLSFDLKLTEAEAMLRYARNVTRFNPFPRPYDSSPYSRNDGLTRPPTDARY